MRAVLDTNVFVSGIHWSGSSEKVLRAWFLKRFELVASIEIVGEITETLASFKIPMGKEDILWWERLITGKSVMVEPKYKASIVKDDPDDNKFIEAALEGMAEYIVSKDNHLLKIVSFRGVQMVTPDRFLEIMGTGTS